MKFRRAVVLGLVLGTACHRRRPESAPVPARPVARRAPTGGIVHNGATLLQAMHERYANDWYRTVDFTQKTTLALPSGGDIVQTWHEAAKLPGRLRIDTDLSTRSGVLFAHDSIFNFNGGKLARADTGMNELLVLGFDVYTQPAERTDAVLRRLGFDLERFHEGTWEGRPVFIVGALRGDTISKQFWVDRDRLLFVRLLEKGPRGITDVRFGDYVPAGKGWIATDVTQLVAGKRQIHEQYSDVRPNVTLPDALFEPADWSRVRPPN